MKLRMPRRKWTLRTRLVVSIVALVALVSLAISVASIIGLENYLVQRVDRQLIDTQAHSVIDRGGPSAMGTPRPDDILTPGLPLGTIAVVINSGTFNSGIQARTNGTAPEFSQKQSDLLLGIDSNGKATTLALGGSLGDYRAVSFDTASGAQVIIAIPLTEVQATVGQFRGVVILISVGGVLIAALASAFIVSLALRPLRRVAATATQVASMPLDKGEVDLAIRVPEADTDPRTEVGQVGAAFNGMLGHVAAALTAREASENKVRQFVADASHELRTPLASIRGYAELTRRGNHDLPTDVVHSIGRVESEALRMTSLVEDLLLLARLDEGRDLEKKPVDLGRLLIDCVSDAYAAGPDHEWVLDAPEEEVRILGDNHRIHQVVANLLTNARVHTPVDTQVTVSLSVMDATTAVITVEDNGPGIAPEVQATLFERFARADTSRSRAAGSTGLGLSIVQAVVAAHGGTVSVASEPGRTAFRVILPGVL